MPRRRSESSNLPDAFGLYLEDISKIPLLTSEDEVRLAALIKAGGPEGEAARLRMIECNARLVIEFAKRYRGRWLLWPDIVAIGNEGLIRAVEKYDPWHDFEKYGRPLRFSTYARWWIRQAIERELNREGRAVRYTITVGSHVREVMRLYQDGFSVEEIAEATDMTPDEVVNVIHLESGTISLDAPVNEESDTNLGEMLPDEVPLFRAKVEDDSLLRALATLSGEEEIILKMSFGFSGKEYSDREIARRLGKQVISIQRARNRALSKLAHPKHQIEDEHGRHPTYPANVVTGRAARTRRTLPDKE